MTLKELIKQQEGCRLTRYRDKFGYWTIGYGHLLDQSDPWPETINEKIAEELLDKDISEATLICARVVPNFSYMDEPRRAAFISMAFNLGEGGLGKFKKMLAHAEKQNWAGCAVEMIDSKWARQVPDRVLSTIKIILSGVM